jgi:hypothetical protein
MKEHRRVFITWLMEKDIPTEDITLKMLASRPSSYVTSCQAYDINGYTYYTKKKTSGVLPKIVAFVSRLLSTRSENHVLWVHTGYMRTRLRREIANTSL